MRTVILSNEMAEFLMTHPVAKVYYEWQKGSGHSEESFFATLIRFKIDNDKGTVYSDVTEDEDTFLNGIYPRYAQWEWFETEDSRLCYGEMQRQVCVFGSGDLPKLYSIRDEKKKLRPLIFNKFKTDVDPVAAILHFQTLLKETFEPLVFTGEGDRQYHELLFQSNAMIHAALTQKYT